MEWFAQAWMKLVELETITNMTHPSWTMSTVDAQRLQALSTDDALLHQLHATYVELCHSHTIMSYATRFAQVSKKAIAEVEKRRQELGYSTLLRRHMDGLEEALNETLARRDSMSDRLKELSSRLEGQINVVGASHSTSCPDLLRSTGRLTKTMPIVI